jgi:hypothetical protein
MNQKSITNQISKHELSLNSTLNYLFNISNMKKLFTYLLISSMVVLSSCTNYDDQFDDLNSQLNTLKSQIDGLAAVSSGVTALQGTVSSLQNAVAALPKTATPATDVSGIITNQTALTAALTALAVQVDAIKTSLAGAATAADVAALAASLATAQTGLSELLASNNVYTPDATNGLVINSAASLTVANSLGDRLGIINGKVTVSNTLAAAMDAAVLATVVGKMGTITGGLEYTHSGTGVTSVDFTKLTSAGSITVAQSAPLSFPMLSTTGVVTLTLDTKVTSVSFPKLVSVTSFNADAITASKATSADLSSLVRYANNFTVTVDTGNVNLSAFVNTNTLGVATTKTLTIAGAETLTAPLLTSGALVANDLTEVALPLWTYFPGSSFTSATTVTLPSVTGQSSAPLSKIDLTAVATSAVTVNITAATKLISTVLTTYVSIDATSHTSLKSLTLGGKFDDVTLTTASKLDALSLSGTAVDVKVTGTDLSDITLAYTPAIISTDLSSLDISTNLKLTSITAATVNDLGSLKIVGNTKLETLSMAALATAGTTTAALVDITGNKLVVDNVQQPSSSTAVPVITRKISSADFGGLKAYLADAATQVGTTGSVKVVADDVLKSTDTSGVATLDPGTAGDNDHVIMNIDMSIKDNTVPGKALTEEFAISNLIGDATFSVNGLISTITNGSSAASFDLATWAAANTANFNNAGVTVTTGKSFYTGNITWTAGVATGTDNYWELAVNGKTFSTTSTGPASTTLQISEALMANVAAGTDVLTSNRYTATTAAAYGFNFSTTAFGSAAAAVTYAINAYESSTKATPIAITATANAMTQPNTFGYIRVVSALGILAGKNATVSAAANVSATLLSDTGADSKISSTGDNEYVQVATDDTASTVSSVAVTAARKNYSSFLSVS